MARPFNANSPLQNVLGLAGGAVLISPSDSPTVMCFGFYVGTTGNVSVKDMYGTTTLLTAVPAGAIIPLICNILNTSTTASTIVGFVP